MAEHINLLLKADKEESDELTGCYHLGNPDCGIFDNMFPMTDKCFSKSKTALGINYLGICKYASIWRSLPDSTSLQVTYIFECSAFGYCKRRKE